MNGYHLTEELCRDLVIVESSKVTGYFGVLGLL